MRILDNYIGRTIAIHTAIVLMVLLAMYFFSAFVEEMGDVGRGDYRVVDALRYALMLVPRLSYELFPLVALLGTMLGLGALANTSELTVVRASGVSVRQVIFSVFKVGVLMVLVVSLIGEVLAPPLEKQARIDRAKAMSENLSVNTEDGLWARDANTFVNIRRLLPDATATDVYLYQLGENHQVERVVHAGRAFYARGAWELSGVRESFISGEGIRTRQVDDFIWESSLNPEVITLVAVPPENLSIWDLWGYIRYMKENGLDARRYQLAMWVRVAAPFATAGMVLLAIPFVFGSMRSVSIGQRIVVGALLGIGFYLFNAVFNRVGLIYNLPPFLAAVLPTFVVYGLWAFMMRRVR